MAGLTAQPLGSPESFNWVFLVELLVCGILGVFFLFYFNRLFATTVSYAIRAYTWHAYRAYIDISALQISLLGGRIFFKSIRYHAHNVTVLVHDGHITWRYWLRLVQQAEIFDVQDFEREKEKYAHTSQDDNDSNASPSEKPNKRNRSVSKVERGRKSKKPQPCRISVKVSAVEAFIYNRSPVYDAIINAAQQKAQTGAKSGNEGEFSEGTTARSSSDHDASQNPAFPSAERVESGNSRRPHPDGKPDLPFFLQILPVQIECKRAAAVLGNEHTTSVITAKVEKAQGTIDAGSAGPLDIFKLLFNFDLEGVNVAMKPNRDFKQHQLDAAQRILREKELERPKPTKQTHLFLHHLRRHWIKFAARFWQRANSSDSLRAASIQSMAGDDPAIIHNHLPGEAQWNGLARYLDDKMPTEHDEWEHVEYAKSSVLADCKMINFRFYWDIPGMVPDSMADGDFLSDSAYSDDINGSKPPAYGLDFGIHGGTIVYGPWADRQRVGLQHIFVPLSFVDATPAKRLEPGDYRVSTVFKIYVSIENDVTLRIPTREPSKDERWQGRAARFQHPPDTGDNVKKRRGKHSNKSKQNKGRKGKQATPAMDARPYGWIDITVKKDTTVNYTMDMFSRTDGFKNYLDMDVKGTEMTSSVNHGLLWRAGTLNLQANLSNPTSWNTLRKWPFTIVCDDMELFILRDHMFLIIDLVNDWSSGPPPAFYTFVRYLYKLDMTFRNFVMYLNVNDANIINDPADLDRNDFLTLEGSDLRGILGISLEQYRPKRSWLEFDVLAHDMRMRMLSPTRSPFVSFFRDKQVATLPKLSLNGSYSANSESGPSFTDTLRFDIVGTGLTLKAYGFLVRQLINLKQNYFGDFVHFRTLEEFQGEKDSEAEMKQTYANTPKLQSSNELDVILCIVAENAIVLAPTNLYVGKEFIKIELARADLDLRVASYYLDMGLNLSPVNVLSESIRNDDDEMPVESASSTQIYVSHCDLSGHRAFGLPPSEPAYVSTWDIDIGKITGECSSVFIRDMALAAQAFIFAFQDGENKLPITSPVEINDITFVQVQTDILKVWLHVGKDAMLISTLPITVSSNDWTGERFSQRVTVLAPLITFACVDGRSASRHRVQAGRKTPVKTHAFLQTGVSVNVVGRKSKFGEERGKQQTHVRQSDLRTGRAPFLQHRRSDMEAEPIDDVEYHAAAMITPKLPPPLDRSGRIIRRPSSIKSLKSVISEDLLKRQQSRSSLASSIRGRERPAENSMFKSTKPRERENNEGSSRSYQSSSRNSSMSSLQQPMYVPAIDVGRAKFGLPPSTMAFASSYAEPYFPLDLVEPDESNVPAFPDNVTGDSDESDSFSMTDEIRDIEPESDAEYTGVFINLEPGLRAYAEPRMAVVVAKLLSKVLPKSYEDVMDSFQMSVMKSITSHQQARHGQNSILEIQATMPAAHIRVVHPGQSGAILDQADIKINSLNQMVQVGQHPSESGAEETLSLRTATQSIHVSLLDQENSTDVKPPALEVALDDVLVWVASAVRRAVHVSLRQVNIAASGEQAPYFARLTSRTIPLVKHIKSKFSKPLDADRKRLLLLIHTLTQHSEGISDPPFLARMTYILRAFPDHFRNQESWKVLSRFRYIMYQLPDSVLERLVSKMRKADFECPSDAPAKILQSWAQWRNWDVPNIGQTLAFRVLFDEMQDLDSGAPEGKPISLTTRVGYLCISLDSSENSNEIVVEESSMNLESQPPTVPTGLMLVEENKRTATAIQLHTSSISISLDWNIYTIAENIIPLATHFSSPMPSKSVEGRRKMSRVLEDGLRRHDFHVVFSTENGSMSLQSLNLRHASRAEEIKLSVVGSTNLNEKYAQCATALLNANRAITELYGTSACIWKTLLTSPSVYIDHLQPPPGVDAPPTARIAAAYNNLEVAIKDQIPGILHTIDAIILDEVSKVMQLVQLATPPKPVDHVETPIIEPSRHKPLKMSIAMLAGDLNLDVSLLSTLNYRLEGEAASIRIAPNLAEKMSFDIDFHIGQQSHSFVNLSRMEKHAQGILELPPINGHVGLGFGQEELAISVATTIEKVEVEAAAIQSVITVINRPEVQSVMSTIQVGIEDIKHHVSDLEIKTSDPSIKKSESNKRIAFDVRFALLGVRIAASTPQMQGRSTAEIELGIGPLHAKASNRNNTTSLIPEVKAQVHDIGARLWIDEDGKHQSCGNISLGLRVQFDSEIHPSGSAARNLKVYSDDLQINTYPETASTAIDVFNHLQDRIRDLDLTKEVEYLRRLRDTRRRTVIARIKKRRQSTGGEEIEDAFSTAELLSSLATTVELRNIQISWLVGAAFTPSQNKKAEDMVLTFESIVFTTRGGNEARLTIQDLMLQLTREKASKKQRSLNSALLPEIGFSVAYWSTGKNRSLAFKASGLPLDLRLESRFIIPVNAVKQSVNYAVDKFKSGTATWSSTPTSTGAPRQKVFDTKRIASLLVEADFAGAQVYMQGTGNFNPILSSRAAASQRSGAQHGRYGQFAADGKLMQTTLKAPGIALKLEYNSNDRQPTVNGEMLIDASTNMLLPNVVPLIIEVSNSIKAVVSDQEKSNPPPGQEQAKEIKRSQRFLPEDSIAAASPSAFFGKTKVDLGLRIRRQEFGLSCQPIARVDAKAALEDFYFTINTIDSAEQYGHFFAMSAVITKLTAQVKHTYSREPTFSYDMDSIALSLMNSKHLSGVSGISTILKLNPTKISINGKQLQDLLLFREIWLPPEIRHTQAAPPPAPTPAPASRPEDYMMHRYQIVAATAAFPWNATISIAELAVDLDLGQSIGKSSFTIVNMWASQQKSSNWEQNLCIGLDEMAVNSTGRMSGFIQLAKLGVRTSITWSKDNHIAKQTPLIQASVGFDKLRAKAAFDYQAFAFADIEGFDFLMYNVRETSLASKNKDRLVAVLDCDKAYVFCTSTSPAQALGLYQAFERLIQEKQTAYMQCLKDIEKHIRRESTIVATKYGPQVPNMPVKPRIEDKSPISLHTDVVLTLGSISFGVFPSTFFDSQILKLEANNIQARFAVGLVDGKINSGLGMTLGQLQVALASVRRMTAVPKALDVTVDEIVTSARNAKGGIILRVPKVIASMQTWQIPRTNQVDYIFKSLFDGKIDVGWNLSRINFIQNMWHTHSRSLASRLGKALPESAVKITAGPDESKEDGGTKTEGQDKITAEINLPQSRFEYRAMEPPIIETPQLRDMGEATPPLEWIGLHRDRLPNLTHQVIIVSLLEVAKEVEDANHTTTDLQQHKNTIHAQATSMPRQPLDPFVEGPLQSHTSALRTQPSQQSLRSNASTASTRTRQQRDLFAPTLSRRPTSRTTRHVDDGVLADPADSEEEPTAAQRQRRRLRHGSPEAKTGRVKSKFVEVAEEEFVIRQADGCFLLGMSCSPGESNRAPQFYSMDEPEDGEMDDEAGNDAHYANLARFYFTSGAALGGRGTKKQEEEFEAMAGPMMLRLREQAMLKIENERWMYEPSSVDVFQMGLR
ncbi:Hypothetical protein R9X50_00093000 [Acrodontium crateriforme]|uniref:Uncharacterized protein n=1 Tax=Acrodontium crateriforme TaxID=150365 RepID=A0AAQ3LZS0_9PEZI|nr:Hypothetical protein R9X50_00093000 [Acrodontium crateriforme]